VNAAARLNGGEILFGDMMGNLLALLPGADRVQALPAQVGMPVADMIATSQGSLILVGTAGVRRIDAAELDQALRRIQG
jgi:hypothetical protein